MEISGTLSGDVFLVSSGNEKARLLKYIFRTGPELNEGDEPKLIITAIGPNHNHSIELQGDPRHIANIMRHIADEISFAINR